jgi:glycosyltransferase involved in cell wall biosynthesis
MNSEKKPLVSIVTPLFNAEKYLAECIESVLAQTYENWEYVIVNNCSTDRSLEIAKNYKKKDKRIIIHENKRFLGLMQNWNHAMRNISRESKYCKVVHADDLIFPECIERMVEIFEKYPSVGIVGSYRLDENHVNLNGLPHHKDFFSGREICRKNLLKGLYVFGSPTSILLRSDLIRKRNNFYNEENQHADKEICFELLQESDFGFVHQVLTYTRRHNESETTLTKRFNTYLAGKLYILKKYGPVYLTKEEYNRRLKRRIDNYHEFIIKNILQNRDKDFFKFHIEELKKAQIKINIFKLVKYVCKALLNPYDTVMAVINGISKPKSKI